jgi:CTP:molybdopterin cytidylyltransferase MocA
MIAAIVPAAGRSERMGLDRPKLLLPIGGTTLIARVIAALREGGADPVVVVVPPPGPAQAGAEELAAEAGRAGACVVVAETPPPDMRASVERGLAFLGQSHLPPPLTLLLTPGDTPGIRPALVARIMAQARARPQAIIVPTVHGRRGHPVALPWSLAVQIRDLPRDVGVNALVAQHAARIITLEVEDPEALDDLDTPEDYGRWAGRDRDREGMDGTS